MYGVWMRSRYGVGRVYKGRERVNVVSWKRGGRKEREVRIGSAYRDVVLVGCGAASGLLVFDVGHKF
jgi:hypothetical protein